MADEDKLARFRHVVAEQIRVIRELREENARLQTIVAQSADAMTVLQQLYADPTVRADIRVQAAKAVLPFQVPKVSIHASLSLAQRLDGAQARVIEHDPKSTA
jgi:hypothetical protein